MRTRVLLSTALALALATTSLHAAPLAPLRTFGGGDGWIAPGEGGYTYLGTANNERGMAFGNGHVYLASRTGGNNIRILNASTGADLGVLNATGITGGTFAVFKQRNPNGVWRLYINDDSANVESGEISGGWSLRIKARVKK